MSRTSGPRCHTPPHNRPAARRLGIERLEDRLPPGDLLAPFVLGLGAGDPADVGRPDVDRPVGGPPGPAYESSQKPSWQVPGFPWGESPPDSPGEPPSDPAANPRRGGPEGESGPYVGPTYDPLGYPPPGGPAGPPPVATVLRPAGAPGRAPAGPAAPPAGGARSGPAAAPLFADSAEADLSIGLLADTDRDGAVGESDLDGRGDWVTSRGSIFSVNLDDDDRNGFSDAVTVNDQGVPVAENFVVEDEADALDLAPLVVRAMGSAFDSGTTVYLATGSVEDMQSIHIFPTIAAGAVAIAGGLGDRAPGGTQLLPYVDITPYVSGTQDVTFGVEGLFFRNTNTSNPRLSFDGYVDLYLFVYQGGTFAGYDQVRMKVAPWILLPDTQPSVDAYAADFGAISRPTLYTEFAESGYYGLDASGQLRAVTQPQAGTQWIQDHVEIGYTQRPGGPATAVLFRLPYFRGAGIPQPAWPQTQFLAPDAATFQLGINLGGGSGDYGGNVELLPPTAAHPLGRIIHGDSGSNALFTFFESQEVQAPFRVPTRWLIVSHADEVVGFDQSGRVILADSRLAYNLMESVPADERGRSVYFATGANPVDGTATGAQTRRIFTGVDYTGQNWRFLRIYDSSASGSGAAGQVARIAPGGLGDGYIDIDRVWNTTSNIIETTTGGPSHQRWATAANPPNSANWFATPQAGDRYVLVEGTRSWSGDPLVSNNAAPSFVTVAEVLADPRLRALHENSIQPTIDAIRAIMDAAAGGPGVLQYVSVPVLYTGRQAGFLTNRSSVAYTPGLQNSVVIGDSLYMPRQFGFRDSSGQDVFELAASAALSNTRFVDGWDLYHRLLGEIHCGVIVRREAFGFGWWDSQP